MRQQYGKISIVPCALLAIKMPSDVCYNLPIFQLWQSIKQQSLYSVLKVTLIKIMYRIKEEEEEETIGIKEYQY